MDLDPTHSSLLRDCGSRLVRARPALLCGAGAVSGAGVGVAAHWDLVEAGLSAIGRAPRFTPDPFPTALAALVGGPPDVLATAIAAAREALADATVDRTQGWLVLGTTMGRDLEAIDELAKELGHALGLGGPLVTVSTACSSSTAAIGLAADLVQTGVAPWVLAGGADELSIELYAGFRALGVLADRPCTPLGPVVGTTLGEGAGFVVVGPDGDGPAVLGSATSSDAHHATTPHPRGRGVRHVIVNALQRARLAGSYVGYVSLHGTGTSANDVAECMGVTAALGRRGVPASSLKGHIGHTQAAAGALELIVTLEGQRRDQMPPSLGCVPPRRRLDVDPIGGDRPRAQKFDSFVSVNAAFGGANAALVIAPSRSVRKQRVRRVFLTAVGRADVGPDLLVRATDCLRNVDPYGLDPAGLLTTLATRQALDATTTPPERRGLYLGMASSPQQSLHTFRQSIRDRGIGHPNAHAFGHLVLHAPAGAASRVLGLQGATTTVSLGAASGLLAFALAAHALAWREDVDALVAASVDEEEGALAFALTAPAAANDELKRTCRVVSCSIDRDASIDCDASPEAAAPLDGARRMAAAFDAICQGRQQTATITAHAPELGRVSITLEAA